VGFPPNINLVVRHNKAGKMAEGDDKQAIIFTPNVFENLTLQNGTKNRINTNERGEINQYKTKMDLT
jgi:hypothetical protein